MFYFNFRLLFYAQALREYLVPGDCYFFFCSFVVYMFFIVKKIKKIRLIFKFYDVTAWLTIKLRSEGNQTMKFGQLIEYNMRNIFLEKSYAKYGGETSPRPFSEKLKLSIKLKLKSLVQVKLSSKLLVFTSY